MLTRRTFIQGAGALAAGAVAPLTASKNFREHGPVVIRTYFLDDHPIKIDGKLYADDARGVFGARVFDNGLEYAQAEIPLVYVRLTAADGRPIRCFVTGRDLVGKTSLDLASMAVKDGDLVFRFGDPNRESAPVWIALADVRRVL